MKFFRYGLIAIVVVVAVFLAGCSRGNVAATVNGQPIPLSRVDEQLAQIQAQHGGQFKGAEAKKMEREFKKQILDSLIDLELVIQQAKKENIPISEKKVEEKLAEMQKGAGFTSQAQLEEALKQQGISLEEFKKRIKERLLWMAMFEKITKDVKISEKQAQDYYNKNKKLYEEPEKIRVKQILVADQKEAESVLKELKKGASFESLAKKYSLDTQSKDKGGELPPLTKSQVVPEFGKVAFALKPGEVSDVVKTSYGFHIIKLIEKIPAQKKTFSQVKERVVQELEDKEKRQKFQKWIEGLRKKADIKIYI
jgi:parvulin-like peptidyl-prolyl isomerase